MKLQPVDGPRTSLGIGPGSDDAVGFHWEFARRFIEGIGKFARNTPGDHREKTKRLTASIPKAIGLAEEALPSQGQPLVLQRPNEEIPRPPPELPSGPLGNVVERQAPTASTFVLSIPNPNTLSSDLTNSL
ncbi:hypothetical protein BHE74_00035041 [Ensete ventricosum]|nr:hypothetical protein BHE74_00035041 [Ensete ventricosum]